MIYHQQNLCFWNLFFELFSPPIFLLLIKPCFLSLFFSLLSFSWFHSELYRFYTHDSQIYVFIRTSFPKSKYVYLSDCVCSSFCFFLYFLCFHYALSPYCLSSKVLSLHFCFAPYTLFIWLLKRFFKILSQILPFPGSKVLHWFPVLTKVCHCVCYSSGFIASFSSSWSFSSL